MRCTMRNCKNVRDINPVSRLCPPCDAWHRDYNKRLSSQERQQNARDQIHEQHRNLGSPGSATHSPPPSGGPPSQPTPPRGGTGSAPTAPQPQRAPPVSNTANFPPINVTPAPSPPTINIVNLQNSYNQARATETESPLMLDMFALMLNIHSKQSETEEVRSEINHANARLDAVEAKIGGPNDISERLGLAVRPLPLPPHGYTDLDMVRQFLAQIPAPGIDVNRDIVKAVRKVSTKPNPNTSQPALGTVLVEMRDEESRASIMKNKHRLQENSNPAFQNLIIRNMKSREQMFMENLGNNILKRITGCENSFVTSNGQVRDNSNHPPHAQYRAPYNPTRAPLTNSNRVPLGPRVPLVPRVPHPGTSAPLFPNPAPGQQFRPNQPQYQPQQQQWQPPLPRQHPQPSQEPLQLYPHQSQLYQACASQPTFIPNNAPYIPSSQSTAPTFGLNYPPPPPPQPQQTPYQDLLGRLDTLYAQPQPSTSSTPDLHLLQPAQPYLGHAAEQGQEQQQHERQQQEEQQQQHLQEQGRGEISDNSD